MTEQGPGSPQAPHIPGAAAGSQKPPAQGSAPFDWAANVEYTLSTDSLLQSGQCGEAEARESESSSKRVLHALQEYSKMGILSLILSRYFPARPRRGSACPPRAAFLAAAALLFGLSSCSPPHESARPRLTVAAAANLESVLPPLAREFENQTGAAVVLTFGATANLSQQIDNGAPYDVFLSADTVHVDKLIASGRLRPESRTIYARGRLALWIPPRESVSIASLDGLRQPEVRFLAIAKPELAPYGKAAAQALDRAGLSEAVQPKIVYAQNVRMARQFAESGNAEAALLAASLVQHAGGTVVPVDSSLHDPLDQALAISRTAESPEAAGEFVQFLLGERAQEAFRGGGYDRPER